MRAIKLDVEKIKHCIDGCKDERGKPPYLIMSSKTKELLLPSSCITLNKEFYMSSSMITTNTVTSPESILIDDKKYVLEKNLDKIATWNECKILIDDTLELGEVYIG